MFALPTRNSRAGAREQEPGVILERRRIFLRPPAPEDWPAWAEVRRRNREYLEPFEPQWPADCLEKDYWKRRVSRQSAYWRNDRGYGFLLFNRKTKSMIGGVNINNVVRGAANFASIGYWIDEQSQGKGLMREALELVLIFAYDTLMLHRINASCMPRNQRSVNLLRRLGFSEEGFAEKYIRINGVWEDHLLFGLNAEDFSADRKAHT